MLKNISEGVKKVHNTDKFKLFSCLNSTGFKHPNVTDNFDWKYRLEKKILVDPKY